MATSSHVSPICNKLIINNFTSAICWIIEHFLASQKFLTHIFAKYQKQLQFTSCKVERPLRGMELQKKEEKTD